MNRAQGPRVVAGHWRAGWALTAGVLLTLAVYWPGLHGGYLFDDFPNIVDNTALHVSTLDAQAWKDAAYSSPSSRFGRPLASLSLAVNLFLTGLDPFWMKWTNLLLHVLNGFLLFVVMRVLLQHAEWTNNELPTSHTNPVAALLAVAWLVAPINLSAVLYVVQRMEILAQTFVLLGLWIYLEGRSRQKAGRRGGLALAVAGLAGGTIIGLGAKETAILLPAYALVCELAVMKFRTHGGRSSRGLMLFFAGVIGIPLIVGLGWLLPGVLDGSAYSNRSFTPQERLLTELRIVSSYIFWTLAPHPNLLGFYHDDIALSRGWLAPPATLLCGLALLGLGAWGAANINRRPLVFLGVFWFFVAHALTATILPLELVYEHRNYFASAGILLAAAAALVFHPGHPARGRVSGAAALILIMWFAGVTAVRALEWSHPLRLASSEALRNPNSPRAAYELGQTLTVTSGYKADSPALAKAQEVLTRAMSLPDASIMPEQGLILIAGRTGRPVADEWWNSIISKFSQRPVRAEEVAALQKLLSCQLSGACPRQTGMMVQVFMAALTHRSPSAHLLTLYAEFSAYQLQDWELAERVAREALLRSKGRPDLARALKPILARADKTPAVVPLAQPATVAPKVD